MMTGGGIVPARRPGERLLDELERLPDLPDFARRLIARAPGQEAGSQAIGAIMEGERKIWPLLRECLEAGGSCRTAASGTGGEAFAAWPAEWLRRAGVLAGAASVLTWNDEPTAGSLTRREFWEHAIRVGVLAEELAAAGVGDRRTTSDLFFHGLMHDIGRGALAAVAPRSLARAMRQWAECGGVAVDAERAVLDVDHTVTGLRLARRWRLPDEWAETIWLHHLPPQLLPARVARGCYVQIVQLADALARRGDVGRGEAAAHTPLLAELTGAIGADADRVETAAAVVDQRLECWLAILDRLDELASTVRAADSGGWTAAGLQARCVEALAAFQAACREGTSLESVCVHAGRAVQSALNLRGVGVFICNDRGNGPAGVLISPEAMRCVSALPSPGEEMVWAQASAVMANSGAWVQPVSGRVQTWFLRNQPDAGPTRVWFIPLLHDERTVAVCMFTAEPEQVTNWLEARSVLPVIGRTLGRTLGETRSRRAAQALAEDMGDAVRRAGQEAAAEADRRLFESLRTMSVGAAHELNNPLAVICARAQMLGDRVETSEAGEELRTIAGQARACSDLVSDWAALGEPQEPVAEELNLAEVLGEFRAGWEAEGILAGAALTIEAASDTPAAWFDRAWLDEIFRELIRNSLEAAGAKSPVITIKVSVDPAEDRVVVRLADNGRGMTPDVLARACVPFFSYRPAGRGRGLGLARVRRRLADGGGAIRLSSRPGEGTLVELRLPLARRRTS